MIAVTHTLTLDETNDASSIETALSIAAQFGLQSEEAKDIAAEVGASVLAWREVVADNGLGAAETERMASAFEHEDLAKAVS